MGTNPSGKRRLTGQSRHEADAAVAWAKTSVRIARDADRHYALLIGTDDASAFTQRLDAARR